MTTSTQVRDVCHAVEAIAPSYLALENDPTGLLLGDPNAAVHRLVVALDVTQAVVAQAQSEGAEMIIAHHPLIYHPLRSIRADNPHPGAVVLACAKAGIAVACAHTCWDVAPGGVNDVLARLLGLQNTRPLQITYREPLVKVVVFVPTEYRESVFEAMAEVGAGAIGGYDRCSFWTGGTGTFRALPGANPFIGTVGTVEEVAENRLEMIAPEHSWQAIVSALRKAHPYEEIAFDVYPLKNTVVEFGLGRVGELAQPLSASDFLLRVRNALAYDAVRVGGGSDREVYRVAVCGGAGASLMPDAIRAEADALVTSDVRHHEFVAAEAHGFLLLDAGHAATESPGARELAYRLAEALPECIVSFT